MMQQVSAFLPVDSTLNANQPVLVRVRISQPVDSRRRRLLLIVQKHPKV